MTKSQPWWEVAYGDVTALLGSERETMMTPGETVWTG